MSIKPQCSVLGTVGQLFVSARDQDAGPVVLSYNLVGLHADAWIHRKEGPNILAWHPSRRFALPFQITALFKARVH